MNGSIIDWMSKILTNYLSLAMPQICHRQTFVPFSILNSDIMTVCDNI